MACASSKMTRLYSCSSNSATLGKVPYVVSIRSYLSIAFGIYAELGLNRSMYCSYF